MDVDSFQLRECCYKYGEQRGPPMAAVLEPPYDIILVCFDPVDKDCLHVQCQFLVLQLVCQYCHLFSLSFKQFLLSSLFFACRHRCQGVDIQAFDGYFGVGGLSQSCVAGPSFGECDTASRRKSEVMYTG